MERQLRHQPARTPYLLLLLGVATGLWGLRAESRIVSYVGAGLAVVALLIGYARSHTR